MMRKFFAICTLTWREKLISPAKEKVLIGDTRVPKWTSEYTDVISQFSVFRKFACFLNCQIIINDKEKLSVQRCRLVFFFGKKIEKKKEKSLRLTGRTNRNTPGVAKWGTHYLLEFR